MAEAVLSAAASQAALLALAEEPLIWRWGSILHKAIKLRTEMQWISCFVQDVEAREVHDERLRQWMMALRDLAYDAEDVLETCVLQIESRKRTHGCGNMVKRYACILSEGWMVHKLKSQMDEIIARLNATCRRLETYHIRSYVQSGHEGPSSRRHRPVHEWPLLQRPTVGLDDQVDIILSALLNDQEAGPAVVSICGMGGAGKTTLAATVFNHGRCRRHFERFAWSYISESSKLGDVWMRILALLYPDFQCEMQSLIKRQDPLLLARKLRDILAEEKCLVVFDDVWNPSFFELLMEAFPKTATRSKILLTSRNQQVAFLARGFTHEVKLLDDEMSWELLQKIVDSTRLDSEDEKNETLEDLGRRMVQHCCGLPLAIISLGGLLATKKISISEWQFVLANIKSYIRKGNSFLVHDVLALSFQDLPPDLKSCFLYLAHFLDEDIPTTKLIQMWIAEGFISRDNFESDGTETPEVVAEYYLMELVQRGMIQVAKRDEKTSKIIACRMHILMREFCLSRAQQDYFAYNNTIGGFHSSDAATLAVVNSRRLSLVLPWLLGSQVNKPRLRSLFLFSEGTGASKQDEFLEKRHDLSSTLVRMAQRHLGMTRKSNYMGVAFALFLVALARAAKRFPKRFSSIISFKNLKNLRVLETRQLPLLQCTNLDEIGNLIHLRYLCLADARAVKLPSSLGRLSLLQTLDLRVDVGQPFAVEIPDVFWRMEQLRHLYLPRRCGPNTKLRLNNLSKLQTLVNLPISKRHLDDVCSLSDLRELRIRGALAVRGKDLKCLNRILSPCGSTLLPADASRYKGLKEDPMPRLGKLPNLRILALEDGAFTVKKMECSAGGFPVLEHLILVSLPELEELSVDSAATPRLQHFQAHDCGKLGVPDKFRSNI